MALNAEAKAASLEIRKTSPEAPKKEKAPWVGPKKGSWVKILRPESYWRLNQNGGFSWLFPCFWVHVSTPNGLGMSSS